MSDDNLQIWQRLETTDPAQTKAFQRQGGFRGTAIKPMYAIKKMTEVFGPCGKGWGIGEPAFEVHGDVVSCRVGIWIIERDADNFPYVWGVGGDTLIKRPRNGDPYPDDEAFKKAYTDALTNAMKHLGMAADVHMGLFDDSKYVAEARKNSAQSAQPPSARPHEPAESRADPGATPAAGQDFGESITLAMQSQWTPETVKARGDQIATALRDPSNKIADLDSLWSQYEDEIMTMPGGAQKGLRKVYDGQHDALGGLPA